MEQAVSQLSATSAALAVLKQEMQSLSSQLPEYPVVIDMFGAVSYTHLDVYKRQGYTLCRHQRRSGQ